MSGQSGASQEQQQMAAQQEQQVQQELAAEKKKQAEEDRRVEAEKLKRLRTETTGTGGLFGAGNDTLG